MRLRRRHTSVLKGTSAFMELPEAGTELRYHDVIPVKGNSEDVDVLTHNSNIALGTLISMILLLVLEIFSGAIAALICAGIIVLTGCVPISKVYNGINWTSVVMIAAIFLMPVGTTTNTKVLGTGGYEFMEYVKVANQLLLIFFIVHYVASSSHMAF